MKKKSMIRLIQFSAVCFLGIIICLYFLFKYNQMQQAASLFAVATSSKKQTLLIGSALVDDILTPIAGGVISFGDKKGLLDSTGNFTIPGVQPGMQTMHLYYKDTLLESADLEIVDGVNHFNFLVNQVIPELMGKHITEPLSEDEIFQPVTPQAFYRGNSKLKRVALTFDDGQKADEALLALLQQYNIKCTLFFLAGQGLMQRSPALIKHLDSLGFEICSHTYLHLILTKLSHDQIRDELRKAQLVITAITGKYYPYLRPPTGKFDARTSAAAAANGQKIIMWSNSLRDIEKNKRLEQQAAEMLADLKNGDIILCHFNGHNTLQVLKIVIPVILERGYEITTLSRVLEGLPLK